jgi:hypothetical protein
VTDWRKGGEDFPEGTGGPLFDGLDELLEWNAPSQERQSTLHSDDTMRQVWDDHLAVNEMLAAFCWRRSSLASP